MGDFQEKMSGGAWVVTNPVVVSPTAQNIALFPILGFCEERTLTLTQEELAFGAELFTPVPELRNHYSSQFGSGIQIPG